MEDQENTDEELAPSVPNSLLGLFPPHKCGMFLEHNTKRNVYRTVAEWVKEEESRSEGGMYEWRNDEQKQRAIATNEVWTLQWYPNTPVGFNAVAAPTLEELLEWAKNLGNE